MDKKTVKYPAFYSAVMLMCLLLPNIIAAEITIQPGISLSEEYNDNIYLTQQNKKDDFITKVSPFMRLNYNSPLWLWDINYAYEYYYFTKNSNENNWAHSLDFLNRTTIIKELFFLEIKDQYKRVSLDPARDYARVSSFINQSDSNILTLNPYFVLRPLSLTKVNLGYNYANAWYRDERAIDRYSNAVYAESKIELSPKLILTAGSKYSQNYNRIDNFNKTDAYIGPRYEYSEGSYVSFLIGNSWIDFEKLNNVRRAFWEAVINQKISLFSISFESAGRFYEPPQEILQKETAYAASVQAETERILIRMSAWRKKLKSIGLVTLETNIVKTTLYGAGPKIDYKITRELTGLFDFRIEKLKDEIAQGTAKRYISSFALEYRFPKELMLFFQHQYSNSRSATIDIDNYKNNRVTVGLKKTFL